MRGDVGGQPDSIVGAAYDLPIASDARAERALPRGDAFTRLLDGEAHEIFVGLWARQRSTLSWRRLAAAQNAPAVTLPIGYLAQSL